MRNTLLYREQYIVSLIDSRGYPRAESLPVVNALGTSANATRPRGCGGRTAPCLPARSRFHHQQIRERITYGQVGRNEIFRPIGCFSGTPLDVTAHLRARPGPVPSTHLRAADDQRDPRSRLRT